MALGEALLVLLHNQSMSGYDLVKALEKPVGFTWQAESQQIYRELTRLQEKGFITHELVLQSTRPDKKMHRLTSTGREHLRHWALKTSEIRDLKDDLPIRLLALDTVDAGVVRSDLKRRAKQHRLRLLEFEGALERLKEVWPLTSQQRGRMLGLRLAIRQERGWVEWCQEALWALSELPAIPGESAPKKAG